MKKPEHNGFTLIELMAAMAIATIVLTIGIPSFAQTIRSNRLSTGANDFLATIALARSEAVKRGGSATVCATGHDWNHWKIEADGEVIRAGEIAGPLALTGSADCISYNGMGFGSGAVNLALCEGGSHKAKTIHVSPVGRASVVDGSC